MRPTAPGGRIWLRSTFAGLRDTITIRRDLYARNHPIVLNDNY
jgi:hypothetical protein